MKLFKPLLVFLVLSAFAPAGSPGNEPPNPVVLAMCQPTLGQILNIEEMIDSGIFPLKHIVLIGVYHEDEENEIQSGIAYAREKRLSWIRFRPIRGKVDRGDLFRENRWTPQFREIVGDSDGILFTGGADIPPVLYGRPSSLLTDASAPIRSLYEVSFLFHLVGGGGNREWLPFLETRKEYPILAICLGAQTLNVAAGGALIQDIPTEVYHLSTAEQVLLQERNQIHSGGYRNAVNPGVSGLPPAFHQIRILRESLLAARTGIAPGQFPNVLTAHHQAIDRLGKGLVIAAVSMDGKVVEAVEHRLYPNVLGVQFHPENLVLYRPDVLFREKPDMEPALNLRSFLEADAVSMTFHRKLWKWFSDSLQARRFLSYLPETAARRMSHSR
jgi:putative glutamine amidotransferase